jgi:mannose-1-phosphate guanylyltransferase/phosphomannomutase
VVSQAVILAGGLGTRLKDVNGRTPKFLTQINGRTVADIQLQEVTESGIRKVLLLLGNGSQEIIDYIEKSPWKNKLEFTYVHESHPLGTGGAVCSALELLEDQFLLICGDIYFSQVLPKFISLVAPNKNLLGVRASDHISDSNLVAVNLSRNVTRILRKPHEKNFRNIALTGVAVLQKSFISTLRDEYGKSKFDLDSEGYPTGLQKHVAFEAMHLPGYLKDIGTPARIAEVSEKDKKDLSPENKAIFLDRDGVINREVGRVNNISDLKLSSDLGYFVKSVRNLGFRVLVVTNQPGIARGDITFEDLEGMHAKIDHELALHDARIDEFFVCPHYPESGFEGEIKELKFDCPCRKPKPGLFKEAIDRYEISVLKSFMIGNANSDFLAASAVRIPYINIGLSVSPNMEYSTVDSLTRALEIIKGQANDN